MKIAISGSSGLIGGALSECLRGRGHEVQRLVRKEPGTAADAAEICWQPNEGAIESGKLEGVDAVVHLAGESIMGVWTKRKKQAIRDSRVKGTQTLSKALAGLDRKPRVLASASAVGYYGDRGDEVLTENSGAGDNFLAKVAEAWEISTDPAAEAGVRVVTMRFGVVLSPKGGALRAMLTPFKLGLGGRLGDGRQWMSWITLEDVIAAIEHALGDESLRGAANLTSPNPVTNAEFTKTLGRVLGRPTILPAPAFALRTALGRMADEMLLASVRCIPSRLTEQGFTFRHPDLEPALRALLGR